MKRFKLEIGSLFGILSLLAVIGMAKAEVSQDIAVRFFNRDTHHLSQAFRGRIPTSNDTPEQAADKTNELHQFFGLFATGRVSVVDLESKGIRLSQEDLQEAVKDAQAITSQTTLAASRYVSAGNVAQFMGNSVSVTGYEVEQPSNERNAAYGDRVEDVIARIKTDGTIFDGGSGASNAMPEPTPKDNGSKNTSDSSDSRAARRIIAGLDVHPFGRTFAYRTPNIWKIGLHAPHSFIQVEVPGLSKSKTGVKQTILQGPTQVGGNGLGTNYYEQVVDQLNGWRAFGPLGAGFEKNVKKFTIYGLAKIGWSKNGGEVVKDEIIQKSFASSSVAQSRNLWSNEADSINFYSTIGGGVIFNAKSWLGLYVEPGYITSGGPSNSQQTSVITPGFTANQHALRKTVQFGITLNLDEIKKK